MIAGRASEYEDKLSAFTDAQLSTHQDAKGIVRKSVLVIYAKQ